MVWKCGQPVFLRRFIRKIKEKTRFAPLLITPDFPVDRNVEKMWICGRVSRYADRTKCINIQTNVNLYKLSTYPHTFFHMWITLFT